MLARRVSSLVGLVAIAYVVFLFLPWAKGADETSIGSRAGVDMVPGFLSLASGVVLVLWEVLGAAGVRRAGRSDSLVSFFLAGSTAILGILGVIHAKWGDSSPFAVDLAYGAFVALALAILLLLGASAHLALHVLGDRRQA